MILIKYELYCQTKPKVKVGEQKYRNVFNEKFNMGFHKPKKDRCEICIEFHNGTPDQAKLLEKNTKIFKEKKTLARELKKSCKEYASDNQETVKCFAFDLQKVLTVPMGEHSSF